MIKSHEEDEFIAVRVQDPRVQNEGSWNSYVDYKIFLHTNSKAFTAKTSCVRRRYSEFAWLKKKLQKNAGLVPVADLPSRSFFSFSNEDFLERRRTGLQLFLDKVLHTTVCLSDSQLHLFLQTQLPVGHILDCVQGHTPYTVTDAILTYASSNQGWAQAQEEEPAQEPGGQNPVPYESMESPAPHVPVMQNKGANPAPAVPPDPHALQAAAEVHDEDAVELQFSSSDDTVSLKVLQRNHHLEAVEERHSPAGATFFLGDIRDETGPDERSSPEDDAEPRNYRIQTPVDVHSPMGAGFEDDRVTTGLGRGTGDDEAKEMDPSARSAPDRDAREEDDGAQGEAAVENLLERHVPSQETALEHVVSEERIAECDRGAEEGVLERVVSEEVLEHDVSSEETRVEHLTSAGNILERANSDEAVPEDCAITEEVPDQAIAEDHILEHVSSHEEEPLDDVGSEEKVLEQVHSEEQAPEHVGSEEKVLEQVHSEEQATKHVGSEEKVPEQVGSEEKVLEQVCSEEQAPEHHNSPEENGTEQESCAEQVLERVPPEDHILEHVGSEEQIVERVGSHEGQLLEHVRFGEEVPEQHVGAEEPVLEHVGSDDVLEHVCENSIPEHAISEEDVLEQAHSVPQTRDHLGSEEEVLERHVGAADDSVAEHVTSEKVLEGSVLGNEEQVPKYAGLPADGVLEVGCADETEPDDTQSDGRGRLDETELDSETGGERTVQCGAGGTIQGPHTPPDQDQEGDALETSDEEDGHLSDKDGDGDDEEEEVIQETNGYMEITCEVSRNHNADVSEVQPSKRLTGTDRGPEAPGDSGEEEEEEENTPHHTTNDGCSGKGLDSSGSLGSGDLTKSGESDLQGGERVAGPADGRRC